MFIRNNVWLAQGFDVFEEVLMDPLEVFIQKQNGYFLTFKG